MRFYSPRSLSTINIVFTRIPFPFPQYHMVRRFTDVHRNRTVLYIQDSTEELSGA